MPELPILSGREAVKIFEQSGFRVVRQKGSHIVLRREERGCVIPDHRELARGTLRGALRQAGLSPEDFMEKYKKK